MIKAINFVGVPGPRSGPGAGTGVVLFTPEGQEDRIGTFQSISGDLQRSRREPFRARLKMTFRAAVAGLLICAASVQAQQPTHPTITVTLLGTGSPPPVMDRFGPSVLVEAGPEKLLFDAGRGALQRLRQRGVSPAQVRTLLLTHLHSDHIVGIPDFWLTGWVNGRPTTALRAFGPDGTRAMFEHLTQAFAFDIAIRISDDRASPEGGRVDATDVGEGVVFERNGVKVTSFFVDHDPIKPALGYRVDYAGRSVVISGDTKYSENLVRHAEGVDLLIHEVVVPSSLRRAGYAADRSERIIVHHTTPERAGELFARVKPRFAVFYHLVLPTATREEILGAVRTTYAGPVEVGEDLMVIDIGERVEVRRPAP
ncbi:MAG TPA: MBL fold metallo-hydrolase [Gemmatimonadaceae bacterium]|nr:MBL fold metallo-hydrolase [Gemmatimonadaceae bacterium]